MAVSLASGIGGAVSATTGTTIVAPASTVTVNTGDLIVGVFLMNPSTSGLTSVAKSTGTATIGTVTTRTKITNGSVVGITAFYVTVTAGGTLNLIATASGTITSAVFAWQAYRGVTQVNTPSISNNTGTGVEMKATLTPGFNNSWIALLGGKHGATNIATGTNTGDTHATVAQVTTANPSGTVSDISAATGAVQASSVKGTSIGVDYNGSAGDAWACDAIEMVAELVPDIISDSPTVSEGLSLSTDVLVEAEFPLPVDILSSVQLLIIRNISVSDAPTTTEGLILSKTAVFDTDAPTSTDALTNLQFPSGPSAPQPSVFDSPTVSEAASLVLPMSLGTVLEQPTATDSIAVAVQASLSKFDQPTVTELLTLGVVTSLSVFDQPTATELTPTIFISGVAPGPNVFDQPTATEFLTLGVVASLSKFDQPTVGDQSAISFISSVSVFDQLSIIEPVTITAQSSLAVHDDPTVTDVASVSSATAALIINAFDQPTVSEVLLLSAQASVTLFDAPTATDSAAITSTSSLSVHDDPVAVDSTIVSTTGARLVSIADSSPVSEFVSLNITKLFVNQFDQTTVTESLVLAVVASKSVFDQPIVTEAALFSVQSSLVLADQATVTDLASVVLKQLVLGVFDQTIATDQATISAGGLAGLYVEQPIAIDFQSLTFNWVLPLFADQPIATEATNLLSPILPLGIFDAPNASESFSLILALAGTLPIFVSEAPVIVDQQNITLALQALHLAVFDQCTVSESVDLSGLLAGILLKGKLQMDIVLNGKTSNAINTGNAGAIGNSLSLHGKTSNTVIKSGVSGNSLDLEGRV